MTKVVMDGAKIKSVDKLHDFFASALDLPDYYGRNLNALWDCVTVWIDLPTIIVWKNFDASKVNWGDEFVEDLLDLFKDAKKELRGQFDYEIR